MNESNPIEPWRLFAAALLSLVVILLWQTYIAPPPVTAPPPIEAPESARELAERPSPTTSLPDLPPVTPAPAEAEATELQVLEPVQAAAERTVVVEASDFRAELSNRGAQVVSFRLLEHLDTQGDELDLVRRRREGPWAFALAGPAEVEALNDELFTVQESREDGVRWVRFHHRSTAGEAVKAFGFRPDGLMSVEISVPGREDWEVTLGPGLRNPSPEELENRFARRSAVFLIGGESADTVDSQKADEVERLPGAGLEWAGLQDSYFLTALVMESPVAEVRLEPILIRREDDETFTFLPFSEELSDGEEELTRDHRMRVLPGQERWSGVAFFGAKEYDRLVSLPYGLEQSVDWGMFGFLARPLLYGLRWIHDNVVSNYGWSIILMTLVIKIVLFPLTHKGYVSMQKMQQLNPKVQAIRQKYRPKLKDKQGRPNAEQQRKMNEEVMALYKTEGVNPAGGCLPLLLQMPVLLAFYNLLSTAIEVRGAPWTMWIVDLSAPDPFRVLPIVMGASQFIQQKLTPASGDPVQRRIFAMMPIFFTILFMGFPSGLVLYWLTNNVLQIIQQAGYNAWKKRRGES